MYVQFSSGRCTSIVRMTVDRHISYSLRVQDRPMITSSQQPVSHARRSSVTVSSRLWFRLHIDSLAYTAGDPSTVTSMLMSLVINMPCFSRYVHRQHTVTPTAAEAVVNDSESAWTHVYMLGTVNKLIGLIIVKQLLGHTSSKGCPYAEIFLTGRTPTCLSLSI